MDDLPKFPPYHPRYYPRLIKQTYHNPADASANSGFDMMTPHEAITWVQHAYGKASEEETRANAKCFFTLMSRELTVDVILKDMDDIQFTDIYLPHSNHKFLHQKLIYAGVMKLKGTGGMYSKVIKSWG